MTNEAASVGGLFLDADFRFWPIVDLESMGRRRPCGPANRPARRSFGPAAPAAKPHRQARQY
jgi:hypothetical protein